MSGRLCTSMFQRASSYTLTFFSTTSYQSQPTHHCHFSSWSNFRSNLLHHSGEDSETGSPSQRDFSTHQDLDFNLRWAQVNSILRFNEQIVNVPEFDGRGLSAVRGFHSNQLAANTPNEDSRSAATCLQSKGMLFGVFDGHGGWACAKVVSKRLLDYIAIAMMPKRCLEELEKDMELGRPLPPILQSHEHRADFTFRSDSASLYLDHLRVFWQNLLHSEEHNQGMSPADALDCAFKQLDTDISLEAQVPLATELMKFTAIQVAFTGCTACVAHVGTDGIHVANAGDCRAVLGVQEEDGSWSALPLSQDHNSHNQVEVERIKAQHPPSERDSIITDERLFGILMPLRAFGDVGFKWRRELQQSILASLDSENDLEFLNLAYHIPPNLLTPPYLDVTPEITYHKLRPQDRFLVLGTDGLWDELCSEKVVQLVGEHLSGVHLQAPLSLSETQLNLGQMHQMLLKRRARASSALDTNAATHLIRHALGTDEYGEFCQERLASTLALPNDLARMYRDDITATVVYFNSELARVHHS